MANVVKLKRGTGSDPSASDMVVGEPVIRTDTAELFFKKDDGTVAKVSGGGGGPDFKYLALRNAANNGSASYPAADFTLVTDGTTTAVTPAAAATLLVSYAGVIQQPSTGTSTPANGFALSGSTIKFSANIAAAPDFIIYQESGGIGEPSDNTVTSAKIVDGAIVNADINASAAIAGTKISPDFGSQNIVTTGNLDIGDLPNTTNNSLMKIAIQDTDGVLKSDDVIKINPNQGVLKVNELYLSNNHVRAGSNGPLHLTTANANGTVDLKINTTHVEVNGNLLPATDSTDNVGASGTRWANVYSDAVNVAGDITVTGTVDGVDIAARNTLFGGLTSSSGVLSNGVTATTQSASDNSTKVATTAYADTAISNLVDSSPGALNTLNELAAALGDDANFSTTVTNSIATKMPLAGGSFVGDVLFDNQSNAGKDIFWDESADYLNFKDNVHATFGDGSDLRIFHDGSHNILLGVNGADFKIKDASNNSAIFDTSAGVELFYANSKKFETLSSGVRVNDWDFTLKARSGYEARLAVVGDNGTQNNDWSRLTAYNGVYKWQNMASGGWETMIEGNGDGNVELYYDNSKKAQTASWGFQVYGNFQLDDSNIAKFGNSGDLQIYHHSNNWSYITHSGSGNLGIESVNDLILRNTSGEVYIDCNENAAVELYYDNTKVFNTTGSGIVVQAPEGNSANLYIYADEGDDNADKWRVQASQSDGNLYIENFTSGSWEKSIRAEGNGDAAMYYDNAKKLETETGGIKVNNGAGGSVYLNMSASGGSSGYLYGGSNQIGLLSEDQEWHLNCIKNSSASLYFDSSKKIETTSTGAIVYCTSSSDNSGLTIRGSEGIPALLNFQSDDGDDSADKCRFYNHQSASELLLQSFESGSWANMVNFKGGGAIEIYYDGSKKFETFSAGFRLCNGSAFTMNSDSSSIYFGASDDMRIMWDGTRSWINNQTTGHFQIRHGGSTFAEFQSGGDFWNKGSIFPWTNNTYDLGSSSYKWRNIYTNDLHLSNEGGDGNSVDGTTGNWTIQEGADDLFIVNNKNGKKFKIALQEVS
jgi:hypothetical protein